MGCFLSCVFQEAQRVLSSCFTVPSGVKCRSSKKSSRHDAPKMQARNELNKKTAPAIDSKVGSKYAGSSFGSFWSLYYDSDNLFALLDPPKQPAKLLWKYHQVYQILKRFLMIAVQPLFRNHTHAPTFPKFCIQSLTSLQEETPQKRGANPPPSPDSKVAVLRSTGGRFTSAVMDKGMTNWNSSPGIKHRCSSWWLSHLKTMLKLEHLQFVRVKITIFTTSLEVPSRKKLIYPTWWRRWIIWTSNQTFLEWGYVSCECETKKEFGS